MHAILRLSGVMGMVLCGERVRREVYGGYIEVLWGSVEGQNDPTQIGYERLFGYKDLTHLNTDFIFQLQTM